MPVGASGLMDYREKFGEHEVVREKTEKSVIIQEKSFYDEFDLQHLQELKDDRGGRPINHTLLNTSKSEKTIIKEDTVQSQVVEANQQQATRDKSYRTLNTHQVLEFDINAQTNTIIDATPQPEVDHDRVLDESDLEQNRNFVGKLEHFKKTVRQHNLDYSKPREIVLGYGQSHTHRDVVNALVAQQQFKKQKIWDTSTMEDTTSIKKKPIIYSIAKKKYQKSQGRIINFEGRTEVFTPKQKNHLQEVEEEFLLKSPTASKAQTLLNTERNDLLGGFGNRHFNNMDKLSDRPTTPGFLQDFGDCFASKMEARAYLDATGRKREVIDLNLSEREQRAEDIVLKALEKANKPKRLLFVDDRQTSGSTLLGSPRGSHQHEENPFKLTIDTELYNLR